jgi:hypothetical protein
MSKEIKKLNFTSIGEGCYELEVEEVGQVGQIKLDPIKKARLHIWVDEDKYQLLKILAVKNKSSVTEIMSDCLDRYLESNA